MFKIKYWGVCDQIPMAPPPSAFVSEFSKFGKNFQNQNPSTLEALPHFLQQQNPTSIVGFGSCSSCIEIQSHSSHLILDAGSGIKRAGDQIMKNFASELSRHSFHLFFSDLHMDRLLGLPFFTPLFIPGTTLNFYSAEPRLKEAVEFVFTKPYFPVEFQRLPSTLNFFTLTPNTTTDIHGFQITPFRIGDSKEPWSFKVSKDQKKYVHCSHALESFDVPPEIFNNPIDLLYLGAHRRGLWDSSQNSQNIQWGLNFAKKIKAKKILFGQYHQDATQIHIEELAKAYPSYFVYEEQSVEL